MKTPARRANDGLLRLALRRSDEQDGDKKTGTFALHTLKDKETIARLATGLKRFDVPDEFNWIKIYERVADRARTSSGAKPPSAISPRNTRIAASIPAPPRSGNVAIKEYGPGKNDWRQNTPRPNRRQLGPLRERPNATRRQGIASSISASATATRSPSRPTPSMSPKLLERRQGLSRSQSRQQARLEQHQRRKTSATASSIRTRPNTSSAKSPTGPSISSRGPITSMTASPSRRR